MIPVDALFLSREALAAAEVPCQWHLSAGIAHGIDAEASGMAGFSSAVVRPALSKAARHGPIVALTPRD